MKINNRIIQFFGLLFCVNQLPLAFAQESTTNFEAHMIAKGNFEVQLVPQTEDDVDAGRMLLDKKYLGDMQGNGKGQMLSKRTTTDGSAGYVAIEQFDGKIGHLEGSFALIHKGMMDRGEGSLDISVIPDSGTEDFVGMTGTMQIDIVDGEHHYQFDYQIVSE